MKTTLRLLPPALAAACLLASPAAQAGVYGDDLARCLVSSTNDGDKRLLVKWIFGSISLHADVAKYVAIPEAEREALDRDTAALFMRLLTDTCQPQARDAVRYEGAGAVGTAFQVLGQVAAQGIFGDPAVAAGTQRLMQYVDEDKMRQALEQPEPQP